MVVLAFTLALIFVFWLIGPMCVRCLPFQKAEQAAKRLVVVVPSLNLTTQKFGTLACVHVSKNELVTLIEDSG